jgi:hypothetical protein
MSKRPSKLLSVGSDAKTVKGEAYGVLTGVLYLAPVNLSGYQVCPKATAGCAAACLYTAGQGVYANVQASRLERTRFFFEEREAFMAVLVEDIKRLIRKATKDDMIPAVRLNGTSDIAWEKFAVTVDGVKHANLMTAFPNLNFYDYTKVLGRKSALALPNYHLTFSLAEDNDADAIKALGQGYNVAVVMSAKRKEAKPDTWGGYPVVDGDQSDIRFHDPKGGHIVALFAKGKATKDATGFVRAKSGGFRTIAVQLKAA